MRISDWSSDVCSSDLTICLAYVSQQWPSTLLTTRQLVGYRSIYGQRWPISANRNRIMENRHRVVIQPYSLNPGPKFGHPNADPTVYEIGRASCRERVCQYV